MTSNQCTLCYRHFIGIGVCYRCHTGNLDREPVVPDAERYWWERFDLCCIAEERRKARRIREAAEQKRKVLRRLNARGRR